MTRILKQEIRKAEDAIDDSCVEFIVLQDAMPAGEKHLIDLSIHVGGRHFCKVMRGSFEKRAKTHGEFVIKSFSTPVRGLLQVKQFYKGEYLKSRRWAWFWFLFTLFLLCYIIWINRVLLGVTV